MVTNVNILFDYNTSQKSYSIDVEKQIVCIDGNLKKIEKEKIDEILSIFIYWKDPKEKNSILDAEEYFIEIISDKGIERFNGRGVYPKEYAGLKKMLGELDG